MARRASSTIITATEEELKFLTVKGATGVRDPSSFGSWNERKWMWIPDQKDGYILAAILNEAGEDVTVGCEHMSRHDILSDAHM